LDDPEGDPVKSEGEAVCKVREALENAAVPCFLVLDNVNNEEDLVEVVPKSGPCHVVVTSRLGALANFHRVKVGVLKQEDGLGLLRGQEAFSVQDEQQLQELADKLGYHTFALAVSSQLLAGRRLRPSVLLEQLKDCGPLVFKPKDADPVFSKCPVLATLFQTTFDLLATDARAGEVEKELALHLAWVGGWFASSPVRLELVTTAAVCLLQASGHVTEASKAQKLGTQAVGLLEFYALATSTSNGRVAFHPLVQSYGKFKGGEGAGVAMIQGLLEVGEVKQDLDHYENAIEQATPVEEGESATIPLELQHGEGILTKIATNLRTYYIAVLFRPLAVDKMIERCALLLRNLCVPEGGLLWASIFDGRASFLQLKGRYREAEPLLRRALEIWEAKLGPGHPDTAKSLNCLARLLKNQGKYGEAEPLCRRALEIQEAELGPVHLEIAVSLDCLAELLKSQGKYGEAEPLYRRALRICKAELGPVHPETAGSLNNLACLLRIQGKYGEAKPLYERASEICKAELGLRHPDSAISYNNLAVLFNDQCKYGDAEPLYRHAVKVLEDVLGADHPKTVMCRENLVQLLDIQARPES
jgi:tetratricopeptide (TPR) repeat protein